MNELSVEKWAVQRALDIAVYAPLGLALTVAEVVPQLARKGRSRLAPQVTLARTVGQFAVKQGYRQFVGFAVPRGAGIFKPGRWSTAPAGRAAPVRPPASSANGHDAGYPAGQPRPGSGNEGPQPAGPGLAAAELAIPSYDSLSAPQVVQRLAGLSRDQIEAVRAYEAATRGRRTILARAEQLLA